ncbi:LysM peptidoglycan-binding domain-containing protein [Melissospora conviva]|uniref:LysM peptidoglycan-binding domain-containing protein n=1 Tax=Melissospora conviva TaxID=3388432 RepID=UPI003B8234C2
MPQQEEKIVMPTRISTPRRIGRFIAGLGALALLVVLLAGAPAALVAFGGNPLPDHVPTFAEVAAGLTSRDDGQLFLRVLALAGWFGWGTFAVSVAAEAVALLGRRSAPRLPGLARQQQVAAALLGALALLAPLGAAAGTLAGTTAVGSADTAAGVAASGAGVAGAGAGVPVRAHQEGRLVYRVARGDYLGGVAQRYLGDFDRYPELAKLNDIGDPDLIHPGQQVRLPASAEDAGPARHAGGRTIRNTPAPPPQRPPSTRPQQPPAQATPPPAQATPPSADPVQPTASAAPSERPATPGAPTTAGTPTTSGAPATSGTPATSGAPSTSGAPVGAPAGRYDAAERADPQLNRPLAISAVLAVAAIIGAQAGALLGLRRRQRPRRD